MPAAAQFDDHAVPDGQDQYGTVYKVKPSAAPMTMALDANGQFVLPSYINSTIVRNDEQFWALQQIPAPGTVFTCPQTIVVEILDTSVTGNPDPWSTLTIELVDVTPPNVTISLDAPTSPHISFGGVTRYVSPVDVMPQPSVSDSCDAQPAVQVLHNGQPLPAGHSIVAEGLHIIYVTATDAFGNESVEQVMFEIQPRPSKAAAAVGEDVQYETDDTGLVSTIEVAMVLGSDQFAPSDIRLSSLRMLLADDQGEWVNIQPMPLKNAFSDDCPIIDHLNVAAVHTDCYWRFTFRGEFAAAAMPETLASVVVLGAGEANGSLSFDFGARASAAPDPDAVNTLLGLIDAIAPCGEPEPPDSEPPLPCEKVETWHQVPTEECRHFWPRLPGPACLVWYDTRILAHPKSIRGDGDLNVHNTSTTTWCTGNTQCSAQNAESLVVTLVGDCCDCQITITAEATVNVRAHVDGSDIGGSWTASATSAGSMSFISQCGTFVASAAATASKTNPNVTSPPVTVEDSGTANALCTVASCSTVFMVQSAGSYISNAASLKNNQGMIADGSAGSTGQIRTWGYADNVEWNAAPCDPDDDCDPIDVPQP